MAHPEGSGRWRFDVTVRHADEGWDHYADKWDVVAPDGTVLATHSDRERLFLEAGRTIVDLAKRYYDKDDDSVLPRNIASRGAFENAMALDIAMGGSTNTVLHILAAAEEAKKRIEQITSDAEVGAVYSGTVKKIMDFGAFVKLEAGVEGLVYISELSHKRVNRVSHVVEEGQRVEVKVLTVDPDAQRISLSMKQAAGAPADGEASQEDDEPIVKHDPKVPLKSLKGGKEGNSGGEQFGLKW